MRWLMLRFIHTTTAFAAVTFFEQLRRSAMIPIRCFQFRPGTKQDEECSRSKYTQILYYLILEQIDMSTLTKYYYYIVTVTID